jgi:phage regulator Rha-like protein
MVTDLLPVQSINNVDVVDSRLIATELEIQHKNFISTLKKYKEEIENDFGALAFETEGLQGTCNYAEFYFLNEDQALYIMTLSKNTEKVRHCKRKLVKSFSFAKQLLVKPKTALELAEEQVKLHKQLELQNAIIADQEKDLLHQAEVIDELFNYSSIIRVAKFNNCSEKAFEYRKLKAASLAMGLEIKQVPCPRFVSKNLYHHDAWRYVYPQFSLPETTTLRINNNQYY